MIAEHLVAHAACLFVQLGENHRLNHEGRRALHRLAADLIKGRNFPVSSRIDVLGGFGVECLGFEKLQAEMQKLQIIACANHYDGPGKVVGNAIALSYAIRNGLGIEPEIVFGTGFSPVSLFRGRAKISTNVLLVGGREKGSVIIKQALDEGKSLILYPERTKSTTLKKGNYKSGRVITGAARRGISVLPIGIFFDSTTRSFVVQAGCFLNNEKIQKLGYCDRDKTGVERDEEKRRSGQDVADYVMSGVALTLPEKLHGYYGNGFKIGS